MVDLHSSKAAVIGSGPAGLMAADVLASAGVHVTLFEKRKGLGRKLLIAGSSGLNISCDCPLTEFHLNYTGPRRHFEGLFQDYSPQDWIQFIENELGIATFKGTSGRYFVEGMKASQLLKAWTQRLKGLGVEILADQEWSGLEFLSGGLHRFHFGENPVRYFGTACLALGGGSYEPHEIPLRWPGILKKQGLELNEFRPANAGFEVDWPAGLLAEAEGKPIKNLVLTSSKGTRSGELVITRYGLEGTPIYFSGVQGTVYLDLKPGLTVEAILQRVSAGKENLSPIRRIKKYLRLSEGAEALVFHLMPQGIRADLKKVVAYLKRFPVELKQPRPLEEAISSSGGLSWNEVDQSLMLRKLPGLFAAGEMLDWDAPTGGFLIQGSVSQGHFVGKRMIQYLNRG